MSTPILIRRSAIDPSTVQIYYCSKLFYQKEKNRLVEYVFTGKNYLDVNTILHFIGLDNEGCSICQKSEEIYSKTTRAEYLKGGCK